jgi:hypothetical protein
MKCSALCVMFGFLNLEDGTTGCPKTSVRNYHYSLRNNPEERNFHLLPLTDKDSCDLDSMGSITYLPANLAGKT